MYAKIRTISRRTWNAAQSWNYEELLEIVFPTGSAKLRLTIRSNAYVDQSYGTLERWDGSRWQQVVHRAGVELQSRNGASGERRPVSLHLVLALA